ncbi:hypothetical protein LCGC14_1230830 [marine sediment metagenome]|uniref:Uncharacterized protein n=1 Tax=marine sediment metagenome TaxID=412755 RepID=A0A0F9L8L1_9ZZZZ
MTELSVAEMAAKKCARKECGRTKELTSTYWPRNKSSKDGFSHWCKTCHSDHRKSKATKIGGAAKTAVAGDES